MAGLWAMGVRPDPHEDRLEPSGAAAKRLLEQRRPQLEQLLGAFLEHAEDRLTVVDV